MKFLKQKLFLLSILLISGCSTLDSLRFWQNDEVDPDEPKELSSFVSQENIKVLWRNSYDGENEIGNFLPSFNAQNIFFSDASGNVLSIDAKTGNDNWSVKLNFLASGTSAGFGIIVVADVDGNVIALDQIDGSVLWSSNVKGEVLSSVAIDAKIVVVKTGSGELLGLNKDSGEVIWSYRSTLPVLTIRGNSSL